VTCGGESKRRPEENASWGDSLFVLHAEHYLRRQVKEDEIAGACDTHPEEEMHAGFKRGKLKARVCWEGLGVDVRMILQLILHRHEYVGERY
jgi:hypothetical protein